MRQASVPGRVRVRGFTLIELMVTIAVAAVLMMIAAPSFVAFQRNAELTSTTNTLIAAINTARGEAMKRGAYAMVVPKDGSQWSSGWIVFVDKDLSMGFDASKDDVVLEQPAPSGYITISGNAEEDVIAIFLSGAEQFGVAQAEHYHDELEKIFSFLSTHPQAARIREELTPSVRVHLHVSHIILYSVTESNDIFIIRVRHAHEDWISS